MQANPENSKILTAECREDWNLGSTGRGHLKSKDLSEAVNCSDQRTPGSRLAYEKCGCFSVYSKGNGSPLVSGIEESRVSGVHFACHL